MGEAVARALTIQAHSFGVDLSLRERSALRQTITAWDEKKK